MHQCSAAPHQIRAITHTVSELQGLESPGFGKGLGGGHFGIFRFTKASAVSPLQPTLPCGHLFISKQSELRQTGTAGRRRLATTEHHVHEAPTAPAPINTHDPTSMSTSMNTDRRVNTDRRNGQDRRQTEKGPPSNYERRRAVEARQPELTELHLDEEELKALGFVKTTSTPQSPT